MTTHLTREEIAGLLLDGATAAQRRHLAECPQCAAAQDADARLVAGLRESAHAAALRDEAAWSQQAQRTMAALRQRERRDKLPRLALAAATAMLLLAAALFQAPPPQPAVATAESEAADEELLRGVQGQLGRDYPLALAPVVHVATERSRLLAANQRSTKESAE